MNTIEPESVEFFTKKLSNTDTPSKFLLEKLIDWLENRANKEEINQLLISTKTMVLILSVLKNKFPKNFNKNLPTLKLLLIFSKNELFYNTINELDDFYNEIIFVLLQTMSNLENYNISITSSEILINFCKNSEKLRLFIENNLRISKNEEYTNYEILIENMKKNIYLESILGVINFVCSLIQATKTKKLIRAEFIASGIKSAFNV